MRNEWVGNYKLHYSIYYSYKNEWINREADLGKCLGHAEAVERAVAYLANCNDVVKPLYLSDGWGNKFTA